MKHIFSAVLLLAAFFAMPLSAPLFAFEAKKVVTDAIADTDYRHPFQALTQKHQTRVLIDRYHQTIYKTQDDSHGAHAMLDIMDRDGFTVSYTDKALDLAKADSDILIIHGLPNDKITLDSGAVFWKSPIGDKELDSIVRWVAGGGSLFLT